jgi:predicted nucleotidyltransferase
VGNGQFAVASYNPLTHHIRMEFQDVQLPPHHQVVVDRFITACQEDGRVTAALLVGSYAKGTADTYSDVDLYLVTTDEAYEAFVAEREAFIRLLGKPLFIENFDLTSVVFLIFSDGAEVELNAGRASEISQILNEPYKILLDKQGIVAGDVPSPQEADTAAQTERLRRQVYWFWHDLAHFITAMARGQLWSGYGQLEILRRYCVNLARLRYNFADEDVGDESYFKLEKAIPVEQLSFLEATFCPMEREAMLQAALVILSFFREAAAQLAERHGISYPADLERLMVARFEELTISRGVIW